MSAADELNLEGCDSPMLSLVYNLDAGANLISYPDPGSMDVAEAIPDDVENLFEAILSEGNAAMNTGNGWVGSLTQELKTRSVVKTIKGFMFVSIGYY